MKEIMGMDGSNGYTMWMYLMPLNSTLKNSSHGKFCYVCITETFKTCVYNIVNQLYFNDIKKNFLNLHKLK